MTQHVAESEGIDVHEAIEVAKDFLQRVYKEEHIKEVGLEEIDHSSEEWLITLGFSRPWSRRKYQADPMKILLSSSAMSADFPLERDYKTVRVGRRSGKVMGMDHFKIP